MPTTELNPLGNEKGLDWGIENRFDKIAIKNRIRTMPNELARAIFRRMEDAANDVSAVTGYPNDETALTNEVLAANTVSLAETRDLFSLLETIISPEFSGRLVAEGNSAIGAGPTVLPPQDQP